MFLNAGLPSPPARREVWDYVEVRDGAHMFWWLYYADSQNADYQNLPLVMWLQVGRNAKNKQTNQNKQKKTDLQISSDHESLKRCQLR